MNKVVSFIDEMLDNKAFIRVLENTKGKLPQGYLRCIEERLEGEFEGKLVTEGEVKVARNRVELHLSNGGLTQFPTLIVRELSC